MTVRESRAQMTAFSGLVPFGAFMRELGIDADFGRHFGRLKTGQGVVYPMSTQLRLMMDVFAVGEHRPFAVEALSADPLFVHLAGGHCPSVDTLYRDLERFDDEAVGALEAMVAAHGLALLRGRRVRELHLDIDTTVTPMFGEHEGALPGPNPRYRGRPSYHPILARIAETDSIVGAALRPGNTGFGDDDVPRLLSWIDRCRATVGPSTLLYVRIDSAGDCTSFMKGVDARGALYVVKAKTTPDLLAAVYMTTRWKTIDRDADGKPLRQVAEIDFQRDVWREAGHSPRVVAVRCRNRDSGRQLYLWEGEDWTVQAFLTNDRGAPIEEVAERYDGRAGVEPLIAELKGSYGIGKAPSHGFAANHAALLLKMLTHNVLRRYAVARHAPLRSWRTPWLRRALLLVPGRIVRRGRRRELHVAMRPAFTLRE